MDRCQRFITNNNLYNTKAPGNHLLLSTHIDNTCNHLMIMAQEKVSSEYLSLQTLYNNSKEDDLSQMNTHFKLAL